MKADGPDYGTVARLTVNEEADAGGRRSVLFTCFLCLVVVAEGYDVGVLNGAAVRLKEDFGCSTLEVAVIVAMTALCIIPGSICGGALADFVGRWRAYLATCAVLTVGPLLMALSQSMPMLICTRGVVGFGIGMGFSVVNVYIAEVAPTAMRGRLTALVGVFMNVGILAGYLVNWWLLGMKDDWRWMFALGAVLPFILMLLLFLPQIDESPRWLFAQGREDEAEEVLSHFVGRTQAGEDVEAMRRQAKCGAAETDESLVSWGEVLRAFGKPGSIRRMLVASILVIGSQLLCGYLPVAYYSSTLLKDSAGARMAFLATIAMGVVKLVVVIITAVGFMFFMAGYELGLGPVAFVYIAEANSTAWRAKSSSLAICLSRVVGSAHLFGFPFAVESLGKSRTFLAQSLLGAAVTAAMWLVVTETKGRSLERMGSVVLGD